MGDKSQPLMMEATYSNGSLNIDRLLDKKQQ